MTVDRRKVRSLFLAAIGDHTPAEWPEFLQRECGDDSQLRNRVETLLRAHQEADSFLDPPAAESPLTIADRSTTEPGTQIGPYKLLEPIGEGGMGTVWMAQQIEPVKRLVAVKLIKAGMDSRQVIARFEAERQALALMDHAHIARVIDAGTTGDGRPYFVMDLVKGVPITNYCDQHHLTPRQRLELFIPVCQAVQHAHQKGIIHRDLKPSNVLVALYDGKPVPKVIDFGVAKAAGQSLTDKTLFTGFGALVGTPEYMSPEQAEVNNQDIDTRSDIYSLGVLLYELLAGSPPFTRKELERAGMLEMLRVIREQEPSKPSTKLSTADGLPTLAANRGTEPARLTRLVRGELDWIVMKALEKDRSRRYETANSFALDVERYLADEAVLACPPSVGYRFRKFARRNKATLATAALVAATLVAGIIGTTWQAVRAMHEADRASSAEALAERRYTKEKSARTAEKLQRQIAVQQKNRAEAALIEVAEQKQRAQANFDKARRAVDEYLNKVTESELLSVPGLQPLREELLEAALRFYAEFTKERADDPTLQRELASAHYRLGRIHQELGNAEKSQKANAEAIRLYEQLREAGHFDQNMQVALGWAYFFARRHDDTMTLCQKVLLAEAGHAEARSLLAETCNALAVADSNKNDVESALKHHTQAFELREALVRDAPNNARYLAQLGGTLNNLGTIVSRQEKIEEAMAMFERAVEYSARAYQRAPHSVLWGGWLCIGLTNLASTQKGLGQQQAALASYERLVAVSQKRAFENPAVTSLRGDLSRAHLLLARYQQYLRKSAEATRSFRQAREVLENIPRETPDQLYELATVYAALAQPPEVVIDPDQEETAERQRHVELTLETLRNAVKAGYANAQTVKTNRLFDILRTRAEFQQLVTGLDKAAQARQLASRNEGTDDQKLADRLRAAQLLNDLVAEQPGGVRHKSTLAATLQSIGVIQTGLKQFGEAEKSLRDAIVLWRELAEAQPDKQELHISRIGSQISLGTLFHESGRSAQAHRTWQDCLAELEQLRARAPHDAALAVHLDWNVMQICDIYGRMGAFTFAAQVARSHLHLQRFRAWPELDLAIVLALFDGDDALREACRTADRERTAADGRGWSEGGLRNLGKVSNLLNPPALSPEQSLLWIERTARAAPDDLWQLSLLAFAQHRAGKSADALATFEKLTDSKDCSTVFAGALIAHGAGRRELARERLQKAEPIFVDYCRQTLQRSPVGLAPPLSQNGHWWELTGPVLLRREAWRLIGNGAVPDEAWLRLIEARADHLLGDAAARDEQLAAAAHSSHIDVWLARARLAAELDQSPDAAWQRAVELAGDDPPIWIQRGRWYAERGEREKADADFARAFQLDPDHPLCRLERARQNRAVITTWDFSNGSAGLTANRDCKLTMANGVLTIDTTDVDPILFTPEFQAGPGRKELVICARHQGILHWQVFWKTTQEGMSEDKSVWFDIDGGNGEWREHRVAFNPSPDFTGLRFDPANDAGAHMELGWIMLADYSAEAELTRAVEQAPDNPLAWIERGRWHAERGEHEQADADFVKAASLTPNELNKFLEAGWWVVGPYPSNLKESCPPETDADPSRPVHVDRTEGLSREPVKWQPAPTGRWGRVDLTSLAVRKDNSSVYCLAYVYSPGEQTKLLMIPRSQPLRVWINGTLVEDYAPGEYPVYPSFESFHRVPVVLRAGRNSLLVKSRMADFTVRIGDTARDRAVLLMEREQFTEALAMRARMTVADRDAQSGAAPRSLGELAVLLGTDEECSEASRSLIALAQHDSSLGKLDIAYYCAHRANPVFADHAATLVAYVDDFLSQPQPNWFLNSGALVHYRAGNFDRSRSLLDQSQSKPYEAPLQALLAHQNGDDVAARKFLDDALKLATEHEGSLEQHNRATFARPCFVWWLEWASFLTMLREAEQAIRGETTQSDALRARSEAIAKAKWTKSPETADFDHAILFGSLDSSGLPKFPQPYLARGRRLRELGRVDEAETDFEKAAELRPDEKRQEAKEPQPPD